MKDQKQTGPASEAAIVKASDHPDNLFRQLIAQRQAGVFVSDETARQDIAAMIDRKRAERGL
ncbi:hypothetical protein LCL97_22170 [Seohaeicola saemankumensis]|nr:hypothetical protein [Seohaeicola saemankumensis]MCA0873547.1 hypothetical protein [Seohaeicola saemankumensis]